MICKNCNFKNDDNAVYCMSCHTRLKPKGGLSLEHNKNKMIKCVVSIAILFIILIVILTIKSNIFDKSDYDTSVLRENNKLEQIFKIDKIDKKSEEFSLGDNFSDISSDNIQNNLNYEYQNDFAIVELDKFSFGYPEYYYNNIEKTQNGYYLSANNGAYFDISIESVDLNEYDLVNVMDQFHSKIKKQLSISQTLLYDDKTTSHNRCIVKGYKDESKKKSVYFLCDVYKYKIQKFTIVIPSAGANEELNHINYIFDSIYRCCSFSGSSYNTRSYDDFINQVVGTKK